ncbi:MAG: pyridoxamine 5'-phosphate oxidase family protein [Deltaproteobacteria bacterium]|nr:pyridoxamine 5'-phosphate oxidase family protein [Deltaproteobacteria bacterium]
MADWYVTLTPEHVDFIRAQHVFFVATATADGGGYPNLSPKGYDCLEILGPAEIVYADLPGSGNQTASHVARGGRITLMFCGFGSQARILRVFGHGRRILPDDDAWEPLVARLRSGVMSSQTRQLIAIDIDKVQTSCGYAVPRYEFVSERDTLRRYYEHAAERGELPAKLVRSRRLQDPV